MKRITRNVMIALLMATVGMFGCAKNDAPIDTAAKPGASGKGVLGQTGERDTEAAHGDHGHPGRHQHPGIA